ncbi:MAG TPA: NAD(P)-binding domain-containing protein [Streptosporangiaceae bacterium]|jgi:3-hydroxyisobutyrate dehydrogenase-like beta-hydroxyacid dehydrogenase
MQVGWLGLGAMGAPMAARAARAGHVVRGYDVVPGRAGILPAGGVRRAPRRGRRGPGIRADSTSAATTWAWAVL